MLAGTRGYSSASPRWSTANEFFPLDLEDRSRCVRGGPARAGERAGYPVSELATIRGVVSDSASQQPVVGAQVIAVGTTRGAITDSTGAYTLRVPAGSSRSACSGWATPQSRERCSRGQQGSHRRFRNACGVDYALRSPGHRLRNAGPRQVTGASPTLHGKDIQRQPVAGIDAALQGRAAGVQVTQNSGEPGNGISVRIRGAASLTASNQPLYVVDGVPIQNDTLSQLIPAAARTRPSSPASIRTRSNRSRC